MKTYYKGIDKSRVAIVIVCMNNPHNIFTCLTSISKYTKVSHEVWVNAYMFSEINLRKVQAAFPFVHWVVNNEIAGFSENNNIILRRIDTEYALVLNDDTELKEPMIDRLVDDLDKNPHISIISPTIYFSNGKIQYCGRNPVSMLDYLLEDMSLMSLSKRPSKFINQEGLFRTYNISGACFLIRINVFKELDFFDEFYFFCPEDIALSTLANKKGYQCWVDAEVGITHYSGQTRKSKIKQATLPALRLGTIHFYSAGSLYKSLLLRCCTFIQSFMKAVYFLLKGKKIEYKAQWNCLESVFSKMTPKEIFIKYYNRIL